MARNDTPLKTAMDALRKMRENYSYDLFAQDMRPIMDAIIALEEAYHQLSRDLWHLNESLADYKVRHGEAHRSPTKMARGETV